MPEYVHKVADRRPHCRPPRGVRSGDESRQLIARVVAGRIGVVVRVVSADLLPARRSARPYLWKDHAGSFRRILHDDAASRWTRGHIARHREIVWVMTSANPCSARRRVSRSAGIEARDTGRDCLSAMSDATRRQRTRDRHTLAFTAERRMGDASAHSAVVSTAASSSAMSLTGRVREAKPPQRGPPDRPRGIESRIRPWKTIPTAGPFRPARPRTVPESARSEPDDDARSVVCGSEPTRRRCR